MRRFASPSPMARPGRVARYGAPVAQCRAMARAGGSLGCSAMFRLTGSRGPGRLSSGTAAGSAALPSHCFALGGIFSREPGRSPGAGAGIRAGKGSVRAPGVPLTAAYCPGGGTGGRGKRTSRQFCREVLIIGGRAVLVGVFRVHCSAGILGGAASLVGVTSVTCQGGRSWSGVGVPDRGSDSTRAGDGPAWSDIVPAPNHRTRAIPSRRPHAGQATGSRVAAVHRRPHPEHRRRARGESVPVSSGTVIPTAPGSTRSSA